MPNSARLQPVVAEESLHGLRPGMQVWIGNASLRIPARDFSLHLPQTPPWEPRPGIADYRWSRKTVIHHIRLLAHHLAAQPQRGGLAPPIRTLPVGPPRPEKPA